MKEIIARIDPKNGDKFSPNLWRFLKRNRLCDEVFRSDDGTLYIGFRDTDDEVCGCRIFDAMADGGKTPTWSYGMRAFESTTWEAVDFWPNYFTVGRCAVDPEHAVPFQSRENRFESIDGEHRRCRWCGAVQLLRRWTETVQRERWESGGILSPLPAREGEG